MLLMLLILFLCGLSFSLSLEELLSSAVEKNPRLSAKRHAVESARLKLRGETQLYYPEFFAGYRFSFQSERQSINMPPSGGFPSFEIRSSKRNYQSLQAGIRQLLYDGGMRASRVNLWESQLRISEEDYREALLEVKLEVIRAYLSVLSSAELLEVVRRQKEAVQADLTQREAFFREGLVAITDVLQARVRLAEVERDLRQAEGNYRISLANLSRLTGIEEVRLRGIRSINIKPEITELEQLLQKALQNRPVIRLTAQRLEVIKNQRRFELSQFHPRVFLEGAYSYSDQNPALSPRGFFVVSAGMSLNFQSLSPYYRALALAEEEKGTREELRDLQQSIILRVRSSYENFLTAEENLKVAEESLKFAEEYYRLSLEQYRNQIISGADLLQAEASRTQALRSKVIAYYKLLEAYFELLREVGEL